MSYERYEYIRVEVADRIATVTMNRPDVLNAAHPGLVEELVNVWVDLARDEDVHAVVLTGAGKAFSAGGDLEGMAQRAGTPEGSRHALRAPANSRRLLQNMLDVPQPIIAAINGHATGLGATLALMCDTTVMSETARIGDTHVKVGLVAGDGGAVIWPLLVGPSRAKDMLMRGLLVDGRKALEMNLVNYAVPAAEVLPEALKIARELAALPKWAVQWTKLSVNKQVKEQLNLVFDASIAYEMLTMHTGDFAEATKAFVEKRKPTFKGE